MPRGVYPRKKVRIPARTWRLYNQSVPLNPTPSSEEKSHKDKLTERLIDHIHDTLHLLKETLNG